MLPCIACSKQLNDASVDASGSPRSPASRDAIGNLATQIKDTALKLSRGHRACAVSNLSREGQLQRCIETEAGSGSGTPHGKSSCSKPAAWRIMFHTSSGSVETMMEEEEHEESKEWKSQVEPGVIITLVSLQGGRNQLKWIRFSREIFNLGQAQVWWAENCDKIKELYNVHAHLKDEPAVVPTPPRSEDERDSKMMADSEADTPVTPPMQNRNLLPGGLYASRKSSFRDADRIDDLQSKENSSKEEHDQEHEWVEEDEPGVYVTIRCSHTCSREIKRVKFSRKKFSAMQAKLWWGENRVRIHEHYMTGRPI